MISMVLSGLGIYSSKRTESSEARTTVDCSTPETQWNFLPQVELTSCPSRKYAPLAATHSNSLSWRAPQPMEEGDRLRHTSRSGSTIPGPCRYTSIHSHLPLLQHPVTFPSASGPWEFSSWSHPSSIQTSEHGSHPTRSIWSST